MEDGLSEHGFFAACLRYVPSSGKLYWRERPASHFRSSGLQRSWNERFSGKEAFTATHGAGYLHGTLGGKTVLAHRVAWFLHCGSWPEGEIDHINGLRTDNRIKNLRVATRQQNAANNAASAGHSSKYKGVSKSKDKWVAYIAGSWLGTFKCETAAAIARHKADIARNGPFARPNCGVSASV